MNYDGEMTELLLQFLLHILFFMMRWDLNYKSELKEQNRK